MLKIEVLYCFLYNVVLPKNEHFKLANLSSASFLQDHLFMLVTSVEQLPTQQQKNIQIEQFFGSSGYYVFGGFKITL